MKFFVHKFSDHVFPRCNFCNNRIGSCLQKQNNAAMLFSFQISLIFVATSIWCICRNIFPCSFLQMHKMNCILFSIGYNWIRPNPAHFTFLRNLVKVYGTSDLFYEKYIIHSLVIVWDLIMKKYCCLRIKYCFICLIRKNIFVIAFVVPRLRILNI